MTIVDDLFGVGGIYMFGFGAPRNWEPKVAGLVG